MRMPPSAVSRPAGKATAKNSGMPKPQRPAAPAVSTASSASGWGSGFSMAAPETREEQCPAATPHASPIFTPVKLADGRAANLAIDDEPSDGPISRSAAPLPCHTSPGAGLPKEASAALEQLAGRLGAAARGDGSPQGSSWEEAFMAGVAVGVALPAAGRRSSAVQQALLAVALAVMLLAASGTALLLAGVAQERPTVYYQ